MTPELARQAARAAVQAYSERFAHYGPRAQWVSDDHLRVGFTARGITLDGGLWFEPGAVVLELEVPLVLRPFTGRAIAVIEREVRDWLDRAQRGVL